MSLPGARLLRLLPAALMLGLIAGVTLTPVVVPPHALPASGWCFACSAHWGIDFILNVGMFVPLGAAFRMARLSPRSAALAIVGTTLTIELLQHFVIYGRISSTGDLLSNTVGGLLGYALVAVSRSLVLPPPRRGTALVAAAASVPVFVLAATAWLFGPHVTAHPVWGQIAAELGDLDRFQGRVIDASLSGLPVRNRRFENLEAVRERLDARDVTVSATVVVGDSMPGGLAPIVSLFDGEHHELVMLAQEQTDLRFRLWRRSSRFGLRSPTVSTWSALPASSREWGGPIRLTGAVRGYAIGAWSARGGDAQARTIHFRPTHGWAFLLPFDHLYTPRAQPFTLAWLALLFAPAGWFAALAVRDARGVARLIAPMLVALSAATALIAMPAAIGIAPAEPHEWQGVLAGLAAGALLASLARALVRRPTPPPPPVAHPPR